MITVYAVAAAFAALAGLFVLAVELCVVVLVGTVRLLAALGALAIEEYQHRKGWRQ